MMDLTGKTYGWLLVLGEGPRVEGGRHRRWLVRCHCGKELLIQHTNLRRQLKRDPISCGCYRQSTEYAAVISTQNTRHGQTNTRTYISWGQMNQRCNNPKANHYDRYGGRGIQVCERWSGPDGFENFLADMGERPEGQTLDRFPNQDGDYGPGNCRWADWFAQARNRSSSKLSDGDVQEVMRLIKAGETKKAIAKRFGMNVRSVFKVQAVERARAA